MKRTSRPRVFLPLLLPALSVVLSPAGSVQAQEVQTWSLEEGTDVLLVEDHRVPLVFLMIELPAGTWSPWVRKHHAQEAFEIQLFDPEGKLRRQTDSLGLEIMLRMDQLSSRIEVTCLRQDLRALLALVRDLLGNNRFDRHELKRRRRQRSLDWAAARKNPRLVLARATAQVLFSATDPRRWRWEKPPKLLVDSERLVVARDTLLRLPGRVIGLAGDLSRAEAEQAAAGLLPEVLGQAPDGIAPVLGGITTITPSGRAQEVPLPGINQVFVSYCRPSPAVGDDDWPAFLVADHVLGGNFFSRLSVALRHQGGETYSARTVNRGGVFADSYALTTYTNAGNAAVAERKLRAVLRQLHAEGISEQERQEAVGFLSGRRLLARQSPKQILVGALWEHRHGFPLGFRDRLIDRAAQLDLDQINAFVKRFYDPAAFTMVKVVPE